MHRMSARDAKNGFGRLIDLARAAPVAIEKYGRSVVVVIASEEYERLSGESTKLSAPKSKKPEGDKKLGASQKRSSKPSKKVI